MPTLKFKQFEPSGGKSDLRQVYVTATDHEWIKKTASDNSSRMVWVVTELINHAKESSETFKRLQKIIIELDDLVPEDAEYPQWLATELDAMAAVMKAND